MASYNPLIDIAAKDILPRVLLILDSRLVFGGWVATCGETIPKDAVDQVIFWAAKDLGYRTTWSRTATYLSPPPCSSADTVRDDPHVLSLLCDEVWFRWRQHTEEHAYWDCNSKELRVMLEHWLTEIGGTL